MKKAKKVLPFLSILVFTACGTTNSGYDITTSHKAQIQEIKYQINGRAEFPETTDKNDKISIKATLSEVASASTVSVIYPSNHASKANQTVATGLTDNNGNFTINPSASFNPGANEIFILEASKRIGKGKQDIISISTYIKLNGSVWDSITTPGISINSNSTALVLISSLNQAHLQPIETFGKISISEGSSVISSINANVTDNTINKVASMVKTVIYQGYDPIRYISFSNGNFIISNPSNI